MSAAMTDEELSQALHGLFAYDTGCTDSGIHDEQLRERCKEAIRALPRGPGETIPRLFFSRDLREQYLSEEALAQGYGIEDVREFLAWLDDSMGFCV